MFFIVNSDGAELMKILITGSSGFLGKFLYKKLNESNHEIFTTSSKKNDLTKENSLNEFNKIKFDQIFHLAAWTQAGDFCLFHPAEQWIINQKINTNVLTWWQKQQPQAKMIAMGTSCSYDPDLLHVEENYLRGKPIDSLFTYAMTKRMLLSGLIAMNKQYGLNYLYLIPSTLYGADYHLDGRLMHFIFDLIRKILKGKFLSEEVVLWGDGTQKRELVYVNDFVDIMIKLVEKHSNTLINIGSGNEYSIKDFAKMICKNVDYDEKKIIYDTTKYVGAKSKILVIDNLKKLLPNLQMTNLSTGLENTIKWFLNNRDKILKS
jgi:GDP-L-fucose synthase